MMPAMAAQCVAVLCLLVALHGGAAVALVSAGAVHGQSAGERDGAVSAPPAATHRPLLGDPGMTFPLPRVEVEGWNFCNRAGPHADPSPRYADCGAASAVGAGGDVVRGAAHTRRLQAGQAHAASTGGGVWRVTGPGPRGNLVTPAMNALTPPTPIPGAPRPPVTSSNAYAGAKERYLGDVCKTAASGGDRAGGGGDHGDGGSAWWSFWALMAKSGNMNYTSDWCVATDVEAAEQARARGSGAVRAPHRIPPVASAHFMHPELLHTSRAMNQPVVFHNWTQPGPCTPVWPRSGEPVQLTAGDGAVVTQCGSFWGSYDVTAPNTTGASLFATVWYYQASGDGTAGSMMWHHRLACNDAYPWLMWYHRADSVDNQSGGYPWCVPPLQPHPCYRCADACDRHRLTLRLWSWLPGWDAACCWSHSTRHRTFA